jgi:hypothetical protein
LPGASAGRVDVAQGRAARALRSSPHLVAVPLDLDREHREKLDADALRNIARKRFNPSGEAWLRVPHAALDSNTGLAHDLGRIGGWVVIDCETGAARRRRRLSAPCPAR